MTRAEGARWIQAAASDLNAAQSLLVDGYYHPLCFSLPASGGKGTQGLIAFTWASPWGHSCFDLLTEIEGLLSSSAIPVTLFNSAQRLDGHYIPSRYPDAFPSGVPSDYYDESTARQAVDDARAIVDFGRGNVP